MPLYEFECESCHRRFERIQKFSDPSPETCPHCGNGPVRKLLSTPAIQFKGSGFYITDYGKDGKKGESTTSSSKESKESKETSSATKDKDSAASKGSESSKSDTPKSESSKSDTSKSDTSTKKE